MSKLQQIELFIDIETKKLTSFQQQYQHAQQHQHQQQKRLSDLENYRLQYLREIKSKVASGSKVNELIQYQNFVSKLDKACEQQVMMINQAVLVTAQRKRQFLTQQKRVDAIAKYHDKKVKKEKLHAERISQKQLDEVANQYVLRRNISPFT
ncbi:MAG: flagellar FliJ family protein [Pseudomonadota bacterium]